MQALMFVIFALPVPSFLTEKYYLVVMNCQEWGKIVQCWCIMRDEGWLEMLRYEKDRVQMATKAIIWIVYQAMFTQMHENCIISSPELKIIRKDNQILK